MNCRTSLRSFKYRRWPLGTCVICPRQSALRYLPGARSIHIFTMKEWVLGSLRSTMPPFANSHALVNRAPCEVGL
jgi:hypothetical protein